MAFFLSQLEVPIPISTFRDGVAASSMMTMWATPFSGAVVQADPRWTLILILRFAR